MTHEVAIIGYGMSARLIHGPLIRSVPGLSVSAVVTRSDGARDLAAAQNPGAAVLGSLEELAGLSPAPSLAVVATPDATHESVTRALLAMGLSSVVEKPLAHTPQAARSLLEEASRRGLRLTGFLNRRWDADFLTTRRIASSGELGATTRFESSLTRWSPATGATWRDDPIPGAIDGALASLGSHLVDQAVVMFGRVSRLYAEVDTRRVASKVNDDVFIALEHANGVRSHLVVGNVRSTPAARFRLQGLEGSFEKHGIDPQQDALLAGGDPASSGWGTEPESSWGVMVRDGRQTRIPTERGDWRQFYLQLEEALRTGGPLPIDTGDLLHDLDVLDAARRSSASHKVVAL